MTVDITNQHHSHMEKTSGQNGNAQAQEPRKLNMEEKRKLEKLLLSDIDTALARYDAQAEEKRRIVIETLTKGPPREVKKLYNAHKAVGKQQKQIDAKLDALGFYIAYDDSLHLSTSGPKAVQLKVHDEVTNAMRGAIQSLKRMYVIKLFADHADTQSLFEELRDDLKPLLD